MRRSILQLKILTALTNGPIASLSQLAMTVGAKRPSVSRSIKLLKNEGLVRRARNGWTLSSSGAKEASLLSPRLIDDITGGIESARRALLNLRTLPVLNMGNLIPDTAALSNSVLSASVLAGRMDAALSDSLLSASSLAKNMSAALSVGMDRPLRDIVSTVSELPLSSLATSNLVTLGPKTNLATSRTVLDGLRQSMTALMGVQAANASAFASIARVWEADFGRASLVSLANLDTALALGNVSLLASSITGAEVRSSITRLLRDLPGVTASFHRQARQVLADAATTTTARDLWVGVSVPSFSVAQYSSGVAVEVRQQPVETSVAIPERLRDELDERLERLNPDFVAMRQGSWTAIEGDNPDRWRHAAISHRELLRQVLAQLMPEVEISFGEPGSKLKAQVKSLLQSDSSADFVVSLANAVAGLYTYLNKPCHTSYRHDAVRAALLTGEGLLLFILVHTSNRASSG